MVHAASLAYYGGHELLAYFSGIQEGDLTRIEVLVDGRRMYSMATDGIPAWNPVWGGCTDGVARLFWKSGYRCSGWNGMLSYFNLNTEAMMHYMLPAGWVGPARTRPVEMDGIIYCGSSTETSLRWAPYLEKYADPWGRENIAGCLERIEIGTPVLKVPKPTLDGRTGFIQPALLEHDGDLHMFMRSTADIGCAGYSSLLRMNEGLDITLMEDLPIANSGLDVVEHGGAIYAVYNDPGSRTRLMLAEISFRKDQNIPSVKSSRVLVTGQLEVSYPCFAKHPDGRLMLAYTDERKSIAVMKVET
jgi:hypothetical protein